MLIKLAGCEDGHTCPAVYVAEEDDATVVVRGYVVADQPTLEQLNLPDGESAVRLPRALLLEAMERMNGHDV